MRPMAVSQRVGPLIAMLIGERRALQKIRHAERDSPAAEDADLRRKARGRGHRYAREHHAIGLELEIAPIIEQKLIRYEGTQRRSEPRDDRVVLHEIVSETVYAA